ncbi:dihydrolipoamide acetyltransferase family protein [Rhodococcoides trifolii]|nr:dihydrolipoamide acetyltransferase family protein [Rhodococcus trifolii]
MSTVSTFRLPDLGEGLTEAELVSWTVAVGDTVELNQIIAEVETAKALVELPSPYAGVVSALKAEAGDTVDVGAEIIDITTGTAEPAVSVDAAEPVSEPEATEPEAAEPERVPVLVGYGVAGDAPSRRRPGAAAPTAAPAHSDRPLASPPVRHAARQNGIDLAQIPATGLHGNVTRDDLNGFGLGRREGETRTPIKGVRKHTADAMVRSAFTAPHVTEFLAVDVTPTLELIETLRASTYFTDVRLTPLALVAKALLLSLRTNPSLNSTWDEDAQEVVTKSYVNLGIAAATPRGLMVPNIKDAHTLGLRDLATRLQSLTSTAKDGKTGPADLADGTITITNVGVFGVDAGTPILNPGEAAILCFGAVRRQPWEYKGDIALRSVTTLSLSFDHRLVDGEQGSRFLADIGRLLADPIGLTALG